MTYIQFSTVDKSNAQRFLNHESFNYLEEVQKNFILTNLGKIRVLDPEMHGGGKISFEDSSLMIEYVKLVVQDPKSFMFNHCYLSPNFELIKWGLEQGFEFYEYSYDRLIKQNRTDILDYLLEKNITTKESLMNNLCYYGNFQTITYYVEKFKLKKLPFLYSLCERFSENELLSLWDKKLVSGKDLSNHCHDKYLKINKTRTVRRKKEKEQAYWDSFRKQA